MHRKRFYKRWWFWVLLFVVVLFVLGIVFKPKESVRYVTETTVKDVLQQTVDASGEVESISEVDLAFEVSGEVKEVFVEVGQAVEPGTVLAELDTTELKADVQSAFQAVQYAKANLEQQRAGSTDEAVAVSKAGADSAEAAFLGAQTNVTNAEVWLNVTEDRYAMEVEVKKITLQSAKDNLSQAKQDNAQDLSEAYRDLLSAAWAAVIEVRSAVSQADEVLGIRDSSANDDFESGLSSRDSGALVKANTAFYTAEKSRNAAEAQLLSLGYTSAHASINYGAQLAEKAALDAAKLLLFTKQVADATLQTSEYTAAELSALRSSIDSARNALQSDQAGLENALQNVQSTVLSTNAAYEDALNALDQAETNLSQTEALADQQVASAESSLDSANATLAIRNADAAQARASLSQTKAAPRSVDLASFEAEVARTAAAYQAALARLEKAKIVSPIAGNVTEIVSEVGEHVIASDPIVTVQTTTEQFQIVSDIAESDITKVEVGDNVDVTFDAYGDDTIVMGFVGELDPAEKMIEGVVYYEATIFFEESFSEITLRPGLSADVIVNTDERASVISLPQRAVTQREGMRYVRVLVDGKPEERQVTTGLLGDLGRVEIVSGLSENEDVIIREIHE